MCACASTCVLYYVIRKTTLTVHICILYIDHKQKQRQATGVDIPNENSVMHKHMMCRYVHCTCTLHMYRVYIIITGLHRMNLIRTCTQYSHDQ